MDSYGHAQCVAHPHSFRGVRHGSLFRHGKEGLEGPIALTALESVSWILAILGYGSAYLNQPPQTLAYFSKAVYPVYIVHFPVQCFLSYYLMPLPLPSVVKLLTLLATTLGASLLLYELAIKRLKWIRPLFGMKFQAS